MGEMSKVETEIHTEYDDENFPCIIRKEGLVVENNGFDKRVIEINGEIKQADARMQNKVKYRL